MRIPILPKLFKSRASPKNTFWQNAYAFFFGPTPSGKTVNERTAMTTSAVYALCGYCRNHCFITPRLPAYWAKQGKGYGP